MLVLDSCVFVCLRSLAMHLVRIGNVILLCSCMLSVFDPAHVFDLGLWICPFLMLPTCKILGVGLMFCSACWYVTHFDLDISFNFVFTFVSWMVLVSPVSPVPSLAQVD